MADLFSPAPTNQWLSTRCGSPVQFMMHDTGEIEVTGDGIKRLPLPNDVLQWRDLLYQASATYGLPAHFLAGLMAEESGGKQRVGSPSGAQGLMELMPATARAAAGRSLTQEEILDPATNIDLGSKVFRQGYDRYHGNLVEALFAYNAGGAYCGGGKCHCLQDPANQGVRCSPNRWNLIADCNSLSQGTIDYATKAIQFANDAILSGAFPLQPPDSSSLSSTASSSPGPVLFFLGLLTLGSAALLAHQHRSLPAR